MSPGYPPLTLTSGRNTLRLHHSSTGQDHEDSRILARFHLLAGLLAGFRKPGFGQLLFHLATFPLHHILQAPRGQAVTFVLDLEDDFRNTFRLTHDVQIQ